MKYRFGGKYHH